MKKPKIDFKDIGAFFLLYLGSLFILVCIHLSAISTTGNISEVINTVFIVLLSIYVALLIFGIAYIIIYVLKWLTWYTQTPEWQRLEQNGKR